MNVSLVVLFAGPPQPSFALPLLCSKIHAFEEILTADRSIYLLGEFYHLSFLEDVRRGLRVESAIGSDVVGQFFADSIKFVAMCVSCVDFCASGEERLRRVHYKYKVMKAAKRPNAIKQQRSLYNLLNKPDHSCISFFLIEGIMIVR